MRGVVDAVRATARNSSNPISSFLAKQLKP
jgi:hypothetical protein